MHRRDFFRSLGSAGGAALLNQLIIRSLAGGTAAAAAGAAPSPTKAHDLPLIIFATAFGGWDVSLFCDPKCGPDFPINNFTSANYVQVGKFTLGPGSAAAVQFFQRYYQQIMVINGINAETGDHGIGNQLANCGSPAAGFPSFAALYAANYGPSLSLGFLSDSGGYDETAHLVAKTIISPSLPTAMASVVGKNSAFSAVEADAIAAAVASSLQRKQAQASLAVRQQNMQQLALARQGWGLFPGVLQTVADLQANVPLTAGITGAPGAYTTATNNSLFLSAQFALAGYVNNATISANIAIGSFDMHSAFAQEYIELDSLFVGLDYLWRAAAYLGVSDNIILVLGSDFSRTPYNIAGPADSGKGHWQDTSSMILMGPRVPGQTLIGQSTNDASFAGLALDPTKLQPAKSGVLLTRAHVHYELRRVAGLLGTALDKRFALAPPGGPVQLLA